ncbi:hypothetical protein [Sphingomonas bacterium]|uniref:hypothetical protein n=1 Tax=Sphingomonas bacterium TaxID=1895847 RepID=UPI00157729A6|nr:hypothetical protein [Sphingomonas bacterium]
MYSETDLESAVAAGAITPANVAALRAHVAARQAAPAVDEEHFRLITGFNDIFVSIAIALLLIALGQIGGQVTSGLGGALVAAASWGLAEYFTARRRMALPSIILLLTFIGGIGAALIGAVVPLDHGWSDRTHALIGGGMALVCAAAAWLHWRRFSVPITVAAGAASLVGVAVALVLAAVPAAKDAVWPLLLIGGVAVFAFAMRWDLSDPERRTRRADVAFWLHLVAAPLIAHPVFQMLGVFGGEVTLATALIVLALYLAFAFVALAVDRRALLVSGLVYVLYAMYALFRSAGAVELSAAFTALIIGSALLTLSAFWQPMRRLVVGTLGSLAGRLPPVALLPV